MYCKLKDTTGPVTLYTPLKKGRKDYVQCNADGSDILAPIESTATRIPDEPALSEAPKRRKKNVVADYASSDDISFE